MLPGKMGAHRIPKRGLEDSYNSIGAQNGSNRAQNTANNLSDFSDFLVCLIIFHSIFGFLIIPKRLINDS